MPAGRPIGTMIAEIDLDRTKYDKALQDMLASSETGAVKVEKAWKNLGVKTDEMYTKMKANAVLSFEAIAKSGTASADEIRRAEEAKNTRIERLNEQQFGKQASLIETLKANWIAASVAIVGAWATVNKAIGYMDEAGKALQAESAFKIMADQAGVNAERMIASMKAVTKETIDDSDMMQKAVKLMTLGFDSAQIERFSAVVLTAAQIAGTTAAQAFDELGDAIANRTPKALIRLGAVTREQMEVVTKAIAAGASETSLFELAMANLEYKQRLLQGTQDSATIALQRFHAEVKNTTEAIGKGLIIAAEGAYRTFQYLAAGVLGLTAAYARYRALVYQAVGDEEKMRENQQLANDAMTARADLLNAVADAITGYAEGTERATATEIAGAKQVVDAKMSELRAIGAKKESQKEYLDYLERTLRFEDEWAKTTAEAWGYVNKQILEHYALLDKGTAEFNASYGKYLQERVEQQKAIEEEEANRKATQTEKDFALAEAARQKDLQSYFAYIDAQLAADESAQRLYVEMDEQRTRQEIADRQKILSVSQNAFADMASAALAMYQATGEKHKEFFRLWQATKIAETLINTYSAAMGAYNAMASIPYVGPALGAAAAAAVIAFGMAQVAAIAAAKPGGGTGGGGGTPPSGGGGGSYSYTPVVDTFADTKKQEGPRPMDVTIHVYGSYIGDKDTFAREISDALRKAQEDRA